MNYVLKILKYFNIQLLINNLICSELNSEFNSQLK